MLLPLLNSNVRAAARALASAECLHQKLLQKAFMKGNVLNGIHHGAGIKGIWNLQKSSSDTFDTYLVLAFVGETRILEINAEDELDEAEIEGFDADQQVCSHQGWKLQQPCKMSLVCT